jgi:hypothetical protein
MCVATSQQTNPDQMAAVRKLLILRDPAGFTMRCERAIRAAPDPARLKYPGVAPGLPH